MTKNIIVTDLNGNITGTTYPKRAKGLIKSGRAIEVDEQTIQLVSSVFTDAFSYDKDTDKEETRMANILDFKARGFKLAGDCTTNRGTRLIVTENDENVECFEIGQGGFETEIRRRVELLKDQDYVFRFAIKSRFVRGEFAESMVSIYFEEKGDGYTYPLDRVDRNRFKPVICKKTDDGLLRVFELPFNSGDADSCTIDICVHDMTAWIYPAKEAAAYDGYDDIDYDQWRQDELHQVAKFVSDIGGTIGETLGETLNGIGGFVGKAGDKLSKAVSDVINRPASEPAEEDTVAEAEDQEADADKTQADAGQQAENSGAPASEESTQGPF
ncbi:MAG: hypothetical protein J5842_08145 [Lachnospiraceae bacterium]|nr:hypothetical protein [Lachnospiraceae bacterium]